MRILVWATTFGSDLWSFTRFLDARQDTQLRVVMSDPRSFRREGVAELYPLRAELIRRSPWNDLLGIPHFRPDVTVLDNRVPLRATSPKVFVLWHGFGWKGPNDAHELRFLHAALTCGWGDPRKPNADFRWQCFGPWDFEHRTRTSGFHPGNCRILGAASHDDLRVPLDRDRAARYYPFDVAGRKTVLFAPTWHYGEVFAHWGSDRELFRRLLRHLRERGANLILRMHDRQRFDRRYIAFLQELEREHPHLLLKFKNENPDNYLDMQVADLLLTNFSSIANLFYATGRPTVHIYPVKSADEAFMWRQHTVIGTIKRKIDSVRYIWKLPPETNGGLLARGFEEMMAQIDRALDEPDCCRERAQAFLDQQMLGADGKSCQRIWDALCELVYN